MTTKEFAEMIDGREYGYNIFSDVRDTAKQNGIVIVYGASDDLMEFEGAIYDEADCFEGGTIRFDKMGLVGRNRPGKNVRSIRAVWHDTGNPCWTYETDIQHETFRIMEDGEIYCIGMVFSVDDLREEI